MEKRMNWADKQRAECEAIIKAKQELCLHVDREWIPVDPRFGKAEMHECWDCGKTLQTRDQCTVCEKIVFDDEIKDFNDQSYCPLCLSQIAAAYLQQSKRGALCFLLGMLLLAVAFALGISPLNMEWPLYVLAPMAVALTIWSFYLTPKERGPELH